MEQKRAKKDTTEQRIGKLEEMLKKETARADAAEEENRQLKVRQWMQRLLCVLICCAAVRAGVPHGSIRARSWRLAAGWHMDV